jgi:glycosyltransferase involved in cell wall biosynthesis
VTMQAPLRALLPAIHRRATGGNVWNRRMFAALHVKGVVLRDGLQLARGTWLIDSLVLHNAAPLLHDGVRAILVAHYLDVLDPSRRDSREAARERTLLPRFDAIVTTSDYARDALRAEGCARVVTVAPGLDERFRAPRLCTPHATVNILTIASLLPVKGLLEFVDVLESIDLDWTWTLAGDASLDPAYAAKLARRIARSRLRARMRVRPPLPPARLLALYDRANVFALPSRFETCSMVTREAMARGLAVAAYDVGGIGANLPRATRHCLAPAGDAHALAARLRVLIADACERERVARANAAAARAFPSWEEAAARLARVVRWGDRRPRLSATKKTGEGACPATG